MLHRNAAGPTTVTIGDPSFTAPTVDRHGPQPGHPAAAEPRRSLPARRRARRMSPQGSVSRERGATRARSSAGAFATQPANTKAIGQILFTTSVISYAAFVIEVPAAPVGTDPLIGGLPLQHRVPERAHGPRTVREHGDVARSRALDRGQRDGGQPGRHPDRRRSSGARRSCARPGRRPPARPRPSSSPMTSAAVA